MAGDTNQCNIAVRIYFEKTNHDRITQKPNCGVTDMIKWPLNPSKTIQSKGIPKSGQPASQLSPDSPCKAPTRKANFVEVLERWGSVPMRQLAFYFLKGVLLDVLLSTECFPSKGKAQTPTVKGCHKQGHHSGLLTSHDAYKIQYRIPFSFLILIPTNCTEQHRKLQHPFLAGASSWIKIIKKRIENQHQFDCASNSRTIWFFPQVNSS